MLQSINSPAVLHAGSNPEAAQRQFYPPGTPVYYAIGQTPPYPGVNILAPYGSASMPDTQAHNVQQPSPQSDLQQAVTQQAATLNVTPITNTSAVEEKAAIAQHSSGSALQGSRHTAPNLASQSTAQQPGPYAQYVVPYGQQAWPSTSGQVLSPPYSPMYYSGSVPGLLSPPLMSPGIGSPGIQSPGAVSPSAQPPSAQSPGAQSPIAATPPSFTQEPLTPVTPTVRKTGNGRGPATYTFKVRPYNELSPGNGIKHFAQLTVEIFQTRPDNLAFQLVDAMITREFNAQRRKHEDSMETEQLSQKDENGYFVCRLCGPDPPRYLHLKSLIRHTSTHFITKPFACLYCDDRFTRTDVARKHLFSCRALRACLSQFGAERAAYIQRRVSSAQRCLPRHGPEKIAHADRQEDCGADLRG